MKQKLTKTKDTAQKLIAILWDLILQVAQVAGAIALYQQNIQAYNIPLSKVAAGILLAAVVVHYLQTRKD